VQRQDEERSTFNVQHSTFKARKTDGGRNAGQATEGRGPDNESGKSQQPQKHKDTEETAEEERSTFGWGWYAAALVFFALTLMAKPALMPLPFALLLLDFWPLGRMQTNEGMLKLARSGLRLLGEKVPFLILSILSGVITVWGHAELKALSLTLPLGMRIENAVVAYAGYIWKTLWPAKLAIFYPHPGEWPTMQVMGSGLLLMGLSAVALWNLWRRPYLAVGWFWFLGMLVPTIGLVQAGEQASADRFCYVPVIGLFLALTWGGFDLLRQRRLEATAGPVIMAVVLGGCALVTSLQVRHWKNPKTLFEHALAVTARNHLAHAALADVCVEDGDFEQARQHVATALEIMPGYAGALRGMGQVLLKQGKPEEALSFLDKALSLSPDDTTAVGFAAAALTALGRAGEAVEHYDRALKLKPDWPEALNNFAWLLATHPDPQIRNGSKAVELAERACQMTGNAKAIYLGTLAAAYAEANRFDDAVATAHRAEARAQAAGDSALAARNEELRRLYEAGSAFRQTP